MTKTYLNAVRRVVKDGVEVEIQANGLSHAQWLRPGGQWTPKTVTPPTTTLLPGGSPTLATRVPVNNSDRYSFRYELERTRRNSTCIVSQHRTDMFEVRKPLSGGYSALYSAIRTTDFRDAPRDFNAITRHELNLPTPVLNDRALYILCTFQ